MPCLSLFDSLVTLKANKNIVLQPIKNLEFNLLIRDSLIKVSCKFEMPIFENAQVILHYVQFAFLFVHTVQCRELVHKCTGCMMFFSSVVLFQKPFSVVKLKKTSRVCLNIYINATFGIGA